MSVTCEDCGLEQYCDLPSTHICSCGSRCFGWKDGTDKPTRVNYSNPNWGARVVEAA